MTFARDASTPAAKAVFARDGKPIVLVPRYGHALAGSGGEFVVSYPYPVDNPDFQFGGLGWTDEPSELVWYPSGGFGERTGILMGAYSIGFSGFMNPPKYAAMAPMNRPIRVLISTAATPMVRLI